MKGTHDTFDKLRRERDAARLAATEAQADAANWRRMYEKAVAERDEVARELHRLCDRVDAHVDAGMRKQT